MRKRVKMKDIARSSVPEGSLARVLEDCLCF
jgi:hypothetical protein